MKHEKNGFLKKTTRDLGYKKAAEFLILIGKDEAAKVMKHLTKDEIEGIMKEVAAIERIDVKSAQRVFQEFGHFLKTNQRVGIGGIDKAREMLSGVFDDEKVQSILAKIPPVKTAPPFAFLMDVDTNRVIMLLKNESPAVISIILPHLKPMLGSQILSTFPSELQKEIVTRIARLQKIHPEVLQKIEETLKNKIRQHGEIITQEIDGKDTLVEILKHMDVGDEKSILNDLNDVSPELAEEIQEKLFTMDIIQHVPEKELQTMLREYTERELVLVLKGIEENIHRYILDNVSSRRREAIRIEYISTGAVLKSEVEKTIHDFLSHLRDQVEKGIVTILRNGDQYVT